MSISTSPAARLSAERRFFLGMASVMLLVIFAGFAPTWFLRSVMYQPTMLAFTPLVICHGLLFSAWTILFMLQVGLVSAGRTDIHRNLGFLGLGFAIAMALAGTLAALYGVARASGAPSIPPLSFMAVPLLAVPSYTGLIITALVKRRDPATHKRLMLLAMVVMLEPAFGRIPAFANPIGLVALPCLFILALIVWDLKSRKQIHKATIWGGLAVFLSFITPFIIWTTPAWLSFASWSSGLVAN